MNIWSKVLVGLILFAALVGFFPLAMMTLKVNDTWRTEANKKEREIYDTRNGVGGAPSIEQLKASIRDGQTALHNVLVDRGRVWYNGVLRGGDAAKGIAVVQIEAPSPHGIFDKSVLYVFDARPKGQGGAYLGEFKVTGVDEKAKQVQLETTMRLLPYQVQRLAESKGPWTLYEVMPGDRPDLLAELTPAALDALLPPETRKEYAKDGQPAEPNDPPERVVDGKYRRELRDYSQIFHEIDRKLSAMRDEQAANEKDLASLEAAKADAAKQVAFTAAEIKDLQAELDRSKVERDEATALRKATETMLAAVKADLQKTLEENKALAGQLTQQQRESADRIEREAAAAAP